MAVCLGRMTESNERLAVWCRRLGQDSRTAPPFSVCLCSFVLPRMIYEWNYTALAFWIRFLSLIIIHLRFILKVVWIPGSFLLIAGECFFVWIYQGVFIYCLKNIWIFPVWGNYEKNVLKGFCVNIKHSLLQGKFWAITLLNLIRNGQIIFQNGYNILHFISNAWEFNHMSFCMFLKINFLKNNFRYTAKLKR